MPRERDAVTQHVTQITQLARRDVGLRQQVAAQQMRERARVDGRLSDEVCVRPWRLVVDV